MKNYLLNILIWIDCGLNMLLFGGSPYEPISSRVGKQRPAKWACIICRLLDKVFGENHCTTSNVNDNGKTLGNWWKL